jgi:hypothetical protein
MLTRPGTQKVGQGFSRGPAESCIQLLPYIQDWKIAVN